MNTLGPANFDVISLSYEAVLFRLVNLVAVISPFKESFIFIAVKNLNHTLRRYGFGSIKTL